MRSASIALVAVTIVVATLILGACSREQETDEAAAKPSSPPMPGEEPAVKLTTEQQAKAGIRVEALRVRELSPEVKAYGQVLDPQPLLDLLAEVQSSQAASHASTKEFAREAGRWRRWQRPARLWSHEEL